MTKLIIESVIMARVTIMASVTYGKCKCNYGKNIMANETEPVKVPLWDNLFFRFYYQIIQLSWH